METPSLKVDLQKLINNVRVIKELCRANSLALTVVTKVVEGEPQIVSHIVREVDSIGDSRICDIKKMLEAGINANFMLIRSPSISEACEVPQICEISLNTEIEVLKRLSEVSIDNGLTHKVIIMLEMGDLREGVLIKDFYDFLKEALKLKGIEIAGIGANATCLTGLIPDEKNLVVLFKALKVFERLTGRKPIVSGGASNLIPLMLKRKVPNYINHIRIGEGIMIGVDAIYKERIPNCFTDCFTLAGEVIEIKVKGVNNIGFQPVDGCSTEKAKNAFGENVSFSKGGLRKRAILNIGRLDTDIKGIKPLNDKIEIIGGTSDHLVLDVEEAGEFRVGEIIEFTLNYSALLYAMNSPYVRKIFINSPSTL